MAAAGDVAGGGKQVRPFDGKRIRDVRAGDDVMYKGAMQEVVTVESLVGGRGESLVR